MLTGHVREVPLDTLAPEIHCGDRPRQDVPLDVVGFERLHAAFLSNTLLQQSSMQGSGHWNAVLQCRTGYKQCPSAHVRNLHAATHAGSVLFSRQQQCRPHKEAHCVLHACGEFVRGAAGLSPGLWSL